MSAFQIQFVQLTTSSKYLVITLLYSLLSSHSVKTLQITETTLPEECIKRRTLSRPETVNPFRTKQNTSSVVDAIFTSSCTNIYPGVVKPSKCRGARINSCPARRHREKSLMKARARVPKRPATYQQGEPSSWKASFVLLGRERKKRRREKGQQEFDKEEDISASGENQQKWWVEPGLVMQVKNEGKHNRKSMKYNVYNRYYNPTLIDKGRNVLIYLGR